MLNSISHTPPHPFPSLLLTKQSSAPSSSANHQSGSGTSTLASPPAAMSTSAGNNAAANHYAHHSSTNEEPNESNTLLDTKTYTLYRQQRDIRQLLVVAQLYLRRLQQTVKQYSGDATAPTNGSEHDTSPLGEDAHSEVQNELPHGTGAQNGISTSDSANASRAGNARSSLTTTASPPPITHTRCPVLVKRLRGKMYPCARVQNGK